jgi:dTDP-glucose 4,6-dehydratase
VRQLSRVLVTGGAGFLGTHLCEWLLRAGAHVVCVDDLCTSAAANVTDLQGWPGLDFVEHDITEPPTDQRLRGPFDVVFHLASPASPPDYLRLPVQTLQVGSQGTTVALDIAERCGARFVLASTSEVYGDPLAHPQAETYWGNVNPIGPRSVYDEAKRFAEALVFAHHRSRGADVAVARIFNTYGPRMRPHDGRAIPTFLRQALQDRPITVFGDGSQTRSFCYVEDEIRGLIALAESGYHDPVNIGNPDEYTLLELAEAVIEVTGSRSEIVFEALPADDPKVRQPDITLAREILDWEPIVELREGLRRTLAQAGRETLVGSAH